MIVNTYATCFSESIRARVPAQPISSQMWNLVIFSYSSWYKSYFSLTYFTGSTPNSGHFLVLYYFQKRSTETSSSSSAFPAFFLAGAFFFALYKEHRNPRLSSHSHVVCHVYCSFTTLLTPCPPQCKSAFSKRSSQPFFPRVFLKFYRLFTWHHASQS